MMVTLLKFLKIFLKIHQLSQQMTLFPSTRTKRAAYGLAQAPHPSQAITHEQKNSKIIPFLPSKDGSTTLKKTKADYYGWLQVTDYFHLIRKQMRQYIIKQMIQVVKTYTVF